MSKHTTSNPIRRRKAYSYARFSTPEQSNGDSLRRQTALAEAYAARHDLDLDGNLTFRDLGVSAYRGKNAEDGGALAAFLEAVHSGLVPQESVLLVENLDRISRAKARKALRVVENIVDSGVSLVTLSDGKWYDADTLDNDPMSLIVAILTMIRGNEESHTKMTRVKESWEKRKRMAADKTSSDKQIITGMGPCWLIPNADRTGWVVDKAKVKIVKRIFSLTLQGWGVNKIGQTFNREGVPSIGRPRRRAAGAAGTGSDGKWHVTFIQKLLANPAVIGEFHDHRCEYDHDKKKNIRSATGEVIKGYYPRIIDPSAFRKVAAQLASRKGKARARNGKVTNLFAGLSRCPCPRCGGTMTTVNKGSGSTINLVCAKAKIGAGCNYHAVRLDAVESAFLEEAEDIALHVPTGNAKLDDEMRDLENQTEGLSHGLDAMMESYRKEPSHFLAREIRAGEIELEKAEARLRELASKEANASIKVLSARAMELRGVLPCPFPVIGKDGKEHPAPVNKEAINAILHRIFDHVVIDYHHGKLVIVWRNGAKTVIQYGRPERRRRKPTKQPSLPAVTRSTTE